MKTAIDARRAIKDAMWATCKRGESVHAEEGRAFPEGTCCLGCAVDVIMAMPKPQKTAEELALMLMSYDADAPHVSGPRLVLTDKEWYPEWTVADLRGWLAMDHHGDCVSQATTCMRCLADQAVHQANWLIERMGA